MITKKFTTGNPVQIDTHLARVFRLKKGVMTTARLVNDRLKAESIRWVPVMVTLTYKNAADWAPNQITAFCNRVQMYAKRRGYKFPCVWVMELQKRGAPHYHVLFWIPARLRLPKADRQGWWVYGSTNIVRVKNPVGYVAKYASKFESKDCQFPHGARIHGIGGITQLEKRIVAWWKLPKDLRTGEEGSCKWNRAIGGGWENRETGEKQLPKWQIKEGIWSANLLYIEPINQTFEEIEEHCAYKAWHAIRRQAATKQYKRDGLIYRSVNLDIYAAVCQEYRWRVDHVRRLRLQYRRSKNLFALVKYFEDVASGVLPF